MWHDIGSWVAWLASKRRDGETLYQTADRIITTHAYLECRGRPKGNGNKHYRDAMVEMLKLNGGNLDTQRKYVHNKIHKYDLMDVLLR